MDRKKNLEIIVLNQISHAIVHQRQASDLIREVLDILYHEMGLKRGTITLRHDDVLYIEASNGLSNEERNRGKYRLGEGITGKVALQGQPLVIPDISKEPEFLDRTGARRSVKNVAFICVPVIHNDEVIGTMSIDRETTHNVDLDRDLSLLETVSNIMADAICALRLEHEEREKLLAENERLRSELDNTKPDDIIGNCSVMRSIYTKISQVAASNATVLIRGASGTGKEMIANAIHRASKRKDLPFIVVNCAALPENLVESELFGHEKGAFTGAVSRRIGRIEAAGEGTIFLDEIGDLGLPMQVKFLRFLQERTFQRIGSNEEIKSSVRILAATSRNLEELMQEGKFREDLYYRLNVFPIHLPELKERRSDIVLLAEYFLEKYNKLYNKKIRRISTPAINMIMSYHWPGNVRELENCIERTVLTVSGEVIHGFHLPPSLQTAQSTGTSAFDNANGTASFETMVASFERELIVEALKNNRGNVAASARALGTTPRVIHYKIERLGITPNWYSAKKKQ